MGNPIVEAKKELIQWIKEMNEFEDIAKLLEIKKRLDSDGSVAEAHAGYVVKDDFDERFAKGLNSEESRKRTKEFISKLSWEK